MGVCSSKMPPLDPMLVQKEVKMMLRELNGDRLSGLGREKVNAHAECTERFMRRHDRPFVWRAALQATEMYMLYRELKFRETRKYKTSLNESERLSVSVV